MKNIVLSFIFILFTLSLSAQKNELKKFPKGYTPEEIGKLMSQRFIDVNKHTLYRGKWINYMEPCNWLGALWYAQSVNDKALVNQLKARFEPLFGEEKGIVPPPINVDLSMFGCLPLELYKATKDQRYFDFGMTYAEAQWALPDTANAEQRSWFDKGFSWQTRLWIDDMYMLTIMQAQAYRVTGERSYIDRAAKEMVLYLDELQKPNGLFYHAPDVPFFWGRGNGWMAAGMAELLKALPKNNPDRPRVMKGYLTMMENLKRYQMPSGMWNQLVDDPECWPETSCTGMFAYAMITGVKEGWLNAKEYAPAARNAWLALVTYVDPKGDLSEVCVGTNKLNDRQYYYDRPRSAGDYHGQAAMLWCAYALIN